jgi:chromosome segregation ATPase
VLQTTCIFHTDPMEFRDYASKETSGLLGRLLSSRADTSLQHIRALRDALDEAARGIQAEADNPQVEQEIQELIRRLNTAASTAARAAAQKVQKEMQAALDAADSELKAQREENERQTAAACDAQARAEADAQALREELKRETERADAADRDLDAAIEAHAQVDAARVEAEAACRQETQARTAVENDLADVRSLLDQTVADAASQSSELDAARAEIADLHATLTTARDEAERARNDALAALDAARRALDSEREQNEQLANAAAEAQAQAEMVQADLVGLQTSMETLKADLARETERAEEANRDLDAAIEAHAAVDAARSEAEASARQHAQNRAAIEKALSGARAELEAAAAHGSRTAMQLDAIMAENRTLAADLSAVQADLEAALRQREAVTAQLDATRARVQTLERNQSSEEENVRRLESSLTDALQAEASAREYAARGDAETARAHADVAAIRGDVDRLGSLLDGSVHAVDDLASTTSVADLLAALVRTLSVEFSRVALFRVKGNRLEGEYQIGFDEAIDITKLVLPLNLDSLITRAASSGLVEQLKGIELDENSRAPFGGTPASALALPVCLQGETVAVLYADTNHTDAESQVYDASAGFAKLMVRTAAVLMTRLAQELKTLNELRDYAAMLLQEARQMYIADQEAGRPDDERRSRLKDTIECARQLYAQRASLEGAAAATLLDDCTASVIEAEPSSPFARDLAEVIGSRVDDSRRTAAS